MDGEALAVMGRALIDAAAEREVEPVLGHLVRAARTLTGARYGAIGVPDGEGGFATFLTEGMDRRTIDAIGWLPRTHGLLGAMLGDTTSYRTPDIRADPRFEGWPAAHPDMGAFLGVPVVDADRVVGAIYVTEKEGGSAFTVEDQTRVEALAASAARAIEQARLWEQSREATILAERAALAREVHDAVSQHVFSLVLLSEAAADEVDHDPRAAQTRMREVTRLARDAQRELRTIVDGLRPADLAVDGLSGALRQHARLVARAHGLSVTLAVDDLDTAPEPARQLLRIAQEALHNAVRHGRPEKLRVALSEDVTGLRLEVADDGSGFDPTEPRLRRTRLGLASMRHRARVLGGTLRIDSAPGEGTRIVARVPR